MASMITAALYVALSRRKPASTIDKIVLASSSAIFWYAGRYLFFGVRWGTASSIWLLDKLRPISSSSQWQPCPTEPAQCDLGSVPSIPQGLDGNIHAQSNDLHFAPVLHTVKTFVEQHPLILTCHLCFIVVAGLLWPLQVWGSFRQESYTRHRIIGRVALASMLGVYATASVIALGHLGSDVSAEKATGLGFAVNIAFSLFSLTMGVVAAKQKDIATHRRHVIRMIGLAYGVFPFKYVWLTLLSMTDVITGEWTYAASVWLSSITGVLVMEWAFLGELPAKDPARNKQLSADAGSKSE